MKPPLSVQSFLAPFLCIACGSPPLLDTTPRTASHAITNATLDDGDLGVVALAFGIGRHLDGLFCTGTLITDRVVVTAAHCVRDQGIYHFRPQVVFGSDMADTAVSIVETVDARVYPDYDRILRTHDIAVLLLKTPAPPGATPWPMSTMALDDSSLGVPLRLVGFGRTGGTEETFGRKHEGWTTIAEYTENTFIFHPDPSQTCGGDSGGPAFLTVDNVETLAGITSTGDPDCVELGKDTRVDVYVDDFLQPYVESTGEGVAQLGQRCFYDENCITGLCVVAADDPYVQYCSTMCNVDANCAPGMECVVEAAGNLLCRYPLPTPGAMGWPCVEDGDCVTGLCARPSADGEYVCSVRCFQENASPCMDGYECRTNPDKPTRSACFHALSKPEEPAGVGCHCNASSNDAGGGLVVCILFFFGIQSRCRRRISSSLQPIGVSSMCNRLRGLP